MADTTTIDAMNRVFREQHRQMIEEQKRLLADYKTYFDGVLQAIEAQAIAINPPPKEEKTEKEEKEIVVKEIAEITALLDDAVKTYGKELTEIITQLKDRQQKQIEAEKNTVSD